MVKCDRRNCLLNNEGFCDDGKIEDGFCVSEEIDHSICEYCGAELEFVKGEKLEYQGFLCSEDYWRCPCGCLDC